MIINLTIHLIKWYSEILEYLIKRKRILYLVRRSGGKYENEGVYIGGLYVA